MKIVYLLLFALTSSGLWAVDKDDIQGTWYRNYGVYRAWSDDNQGTVSSFEEDLIFHQDDTVFIYDKNSNTYRGKSTYRIVERDGKDFIVFYKPGDNPNDDAVQKKQGYFVTIKQDRDKHDVLTLTTVKDYERARNKSNARSTTYKRVRESYGEDAKFVTPSNEL